MPIEVNEGLLRAIALKEKTISDGRTLAAEGAYRNTGRTADGSLLWGQCQGSSLYSPSLDLDGEKPTSRCTCPVKPPPCKHVLGLVVSFLENPGRFKVGDPPKDLQEKRAKAQDRAEKRAEAAAKPPKVNKAALAKKAGTQRDGLELLEKLVVDVAAKGIGTLDPKAAARLSEQARQLNDSYLKGAAVAAMRLASLAANETLPDEDRRLVLLRQLTRLWAMVRKGRAHLDAKLEEGETQGDADAVVEELLGHDWKLVELREKGFVRQNLELVELAFERFDDAVREERFEESALVDLSDGTVFIDLNMRPLAALDKTREKESFEEILQISEAAVYPGFVNRRVRWEVAAARRRPVTKDDWARVHRAALSDYDAALGKFKEQIKNPLAPAKAAFLLGVKEFVCTPAGTAAVSPSGRKLLLKDSPLSRAKTTSLLETCAGGLAPPLSLLVRFWTDLAGSSVMGQPLSLLAGERLLRLSM